VTGHTIEKVLGGEVVKEVRLDDARHLPCDLLVLAVGVTPNVELARSGGLKVCRGIVVNSRMETSVPGTYACGDCAEVLDYSLGSSRLVPTWPAAYAGGRVAGFNMAGRVREWEGTTSMNSMHAFGRSVMTLGRTNPKEDERCDILWKLDESRSTYRKVVLYRGRVVGAILVDEVDGAGVILSLMRKRVEVTSFREELLKEDFGLACVPRATREGALEVYFNGAVE
jgi:NAD(P)H-nitrite reductase large subunit